MHATRSFVFVAALAIAACTGGEAVKPADTDAKAHTETKPEASKPAEPVVSSEDKGLVPSPLETQRELERAGIQTQLRDLIQEQAFDTAAEDKDKVAIRTGVVIARMLLTVKTAEKDKLLSHLAGIKAGLAALDGGDDINVMIADIEDRVKGDSVDRDNLLKELDELSGAFIPELEFNGQKRIVPLIQAGSWLEGSNLVARAVKAAGNPSAGDSLLKQEAVVGYFKRYVREEGADKAPAAVSQKLEESLGRLETLSKKAEPFTAEDIDAVEKTTKDVLALL